MTHRFSTRVGLSMMLAGAIFLSATLPAHATVDDSLVPALPSSVTFTKGKIKFQEEDGKIKLVIKAINVPVGTPGTLVLSLMINDGVPEERQFPFVVKEDDGKPFNKIKLKVSLVDELGLAIGDVVKILRTEVVIAEDIVAVPGIVIEAKEDVQDTIPDMETEPETDTVPDTDETPVEIAATASGTYTLDAGVLTATTTASEFGDCNGLSVGTTEFTVLSITSTTLILEEEDEGEVEQSIFTRESGTDGDIVGTWTLIDEDGAHTLVIEANGSFSLVGNVVTDCDDEG